MWLQWLFNSKKSIICTTSCDVTKLLTPPPLCHNCYKNETPSLLLAWHHLSMLPKCLFRTFCLVGYKLSQVSKCQTCVLVESRCLKCLNLPRDLKLLVNNLQWNGWRFQRRQKSCLIQHFYLSLISTFN